MAQMHSTQKKVHQYAHHTYQRLDALLTEVITPEDLAKLGLRQPQLPEIWPPRQFTKSKTPPLAMESFSSAQEFSLKKLKTLRLFLTLQRHAFDLMLSIEALFWDVNSSLSFLFI